MAERWVTPERLMEVIGKHARLENVYEALKKYCYWDLDFESMQEESTCRGLHNEVYRRYNRTIKFVLPWIVSATSRNLRNTSGIEIGCGTGSSSVAIAPYLKKLYALEILEDRLEVARKRAKAYNIKNIEYFLCKPEEILNVVLRITKGEKIGAIFLFAVLEHLTIEERLGYLRKIHSILSAEDILVITECPNRLTYDDRHTSKLPFFDLLPAELALKYAKISPRPGFRRHFSSLKDNDSSVERLYRAGKGASYHEFEIAIGPDYQNFILANGCEKEIIEWYPPDCEEAILKSYFLKNSLNVNLGFARSVLNLIFRGRC